jgi:polysaccharide deacetylase 2 family uncharacterized protein YibQ
MPRDELRQPLRKRSRWERLWARRPSLIATATVLTFAAYGGAAAWLARHPVPFAGEPVVIAAIPPVEELVTGATDKAPDAEPADSEPTEDAVDLAQDAPPEPALNELKITGDQPQMVYARQRPLKAAPFLAITEQTSDGPLPKVGPGNKRASDLYAQAIPMGVLASDRPKVALLLGGMGLNPKLTQKAIQTLPGDVTFGFAPYGNDLQTQVNLARNRGHEVMLQLPLEPQGYPAINPGPNTLTTDAGHEANLQALRWNMSRFAGYMGITNYMGGRFLAEPRAVQPVLAEMQKRGLVFLQDATVGVSSADQIGGSLRLPVRHGEVVIDANPDRDSINAALRQLELQAKAHGFAVGTGTGLDVTIETVNEWAADLDKRGIVLVPVSAAFKGKTG